MKATVCGCILPREAACQHEPSKADMAQDIADLSQQLAAAQEKVNRLEQELEYVYAERNHLAMTYAAIFALHPEPPTDTGEGE